VPSSLESGFMQVFAAAGRELLGDRSVGNIGIKSKISCCIGVPMNQEATFVRART